jgi:tetratricopeptide (TPR) repeat protein
MSIRYFNFFLFLIILSSLFVSPGEVNGKSLLRRPVEYYLRKGKLQFRAEMYDYAVLNLQLALDGNPDLNEALNILADIYIMRNNRQKGIELLERSLAINSRQGDIHTKIGELYMFFAEDRLAVHHFKEAVKLKPNNIRANLNLSRYYILEGKKKLSEKHFRISYSAGKIKAARFYNGGISAYSEGKYEKGIENLRKAIELGPAYTEAYVALADIYRNRKRYRKAADIMERLKFIKPDYEKAYLYLGSIYFNRKLPGKRIYYINLAIKNLEKAIEINPKNPDTYFFLGDIHRFIGNSLAAAKYETMGLQQEKINKK